MDWGRKLRVHVGVRRETIVSTSRELKARTRVSAVWRCFDGMLLFERR